MSKVDSSTMVFKAGYQSDDDPLEFVLSDESVDRVGDIIRADGWKLSDFKKNPIALFGHNHRDVLGVWTKVRVEGKKLLGVLRLAEEGTSELVDTVRKLLDQRILKAVSVGFMPLEGQPRDEKDPWGGYDFTKASLHEASVVAVPANPNALAIAKALSPGVAEKLFVRPNIESAMLPGGIVSGRVTSEMKTPNLEEVRLRAKTLGIKL
jgi:HK97 family phage prohead protease